ncbi:MAG TPA: glycosyltransferase family 1 protein, partial [Acidimicrobiia bacterium]|nr:glycosyltransferase family 1 protein [Acidimicrobiia bacterium]
MKLAVITPRYGAQITGGAETAARALAIRLAQLPDWQVDVHTTCALDHATWANAIKPGTTTEDGVRVHRARVEGTRAADFETRSARVLARPRHAAPELEEDWLRAQGPVAPALVEAVA